MKKLMIAAAIVCAAAYVQAASILWGGAAAYGSDYADFAEGQTAYLIYTGSSQAALAALITIDDAADFSTWTVDNGGTVVDSYTFTATDVNPDVAKFSKTYALAEADGNINGWYQVVIADPEMTQFTVNDIGQVVGATDQTTAFDARVNMSWEGDEYLGSAGYTGTIETVPEPTTGLLMLLGMGALALRRRRA